MSHALAAFQDITERRQTEQLLADYNRTLEQQVWNERRQHTAKQSYRHYLQPFPTRSLC